MEWVCFGDGGGVEMKEINRDKMEEINNRSFFDYLQNGVFFRYYVQPVESAVKAALYATGEDTFANYVHVKAAQREAAQNFLDDLKEEVKFLDDVDKSQWVDLKELIESVFEARLNKQRNIKISKKRNKQSPDRDKKQDMKSLEEAIALLKNFSEIYEPYQEVIYTMENGVDFSVSRSSITDIANKLQIISRDELESPRGKSYYYRDTPITQASFKKRVIEIITQDEADRQHINEKINSLCAMLNKKV